MGILPLILFATGLVGLFLTLNYAEENGKNKSFKNVFLAILGVCLIVPSYMFFGLVLEQTSPSNIKASKFKVHTEIKTTSLNGIETSRDTVYVFTPKKKN